MAAMHVFCHRVLLILLAITVSDLATLASGSELVEQLRHPVAVFQPGTSTHLAVLNRRSGTVSWIDTRQRTMVHEHQVAQQISAGCPLPDGRMVVLDDAANELIVLARDSAEVLSRIPIAATPICVVTTQGGQSCVVASTWARRLTVVDVSAADLATVVRTIDLPFAPRHMLCINDDDILVADAFSGSLALVSTTRGCVARHRELKATHNISGIARGQDPDWVYVTHQMLSDAEATTASNVHWGAVMSNVVRRFSLTWFVSDAPEETTAADLYYLGHPDEAAGDPQGILRTYTNRFMLMLSGVDQVAISDRGLNHFRRLPVGRRPLAMWLDEAHDELFVANYWDDTVTVIDLSRSRAVATISLGPQPPLTLADQGEQLFYNARLSSDGWYSCHSCHTDGHTNGYRSDTFGDGYQGSAKQVPSLLGTAETAPWAWNGQMTMLENQIRKSIETTMRGSEPSTHEVQALAAYLMSLSAPPSRDQARGEQDVQSVERGRIVFHEQGCAECHRPPTYTSRDVYDVGLTDNDGQRRFNPPSLLGVGHRRRLLHDGRAQGFHPLLRIHPHGEPLNIDVTQQNLLCEFLMSL